MSYYFDHKGRPQLIDPVSETWACLPTASGFEYPRDQFDLSSSSASKESWDTYVPVSLLPTGSRIVPLPNGWEGITWDPIESDNELSPQPQPIYNTFTKLLELPSELQVQIWIAASHLSTLLEVELRDNYRQEVRSVSDTFHSWADYIPITPSPAITRTCFLSRSISLPYHTYHPNIPNYIVPKFDCLYMHIKELPSDSTPPSEFSIDLSSITSLAITHFQLNDDATFFWPDSFEYAHRLINFPSLTELILVEPENEWWIEVDGGKDYNLKMVMGSEVKRYDQRRLEILQKHLRERMKEKIGPRSAWWRNPKITILTEGEVRGRYAC